jgi:hypothetical protein
MHTSSNASVCVEKSGYEGDHEPGVNVSFGRPKTDDTQLVSPPLNSARSEGERSISLCLTNSRGIIFCPARSGTVAVSAFGVAAAFTHN